MPGSVGGERRGAARAMVMRRGKIVESGAVEQALVDAAVTRILEWKYDLGLLEEQSKG